MSGAGGLHGDMSAPKPETFPSVRVRGRYVELALGPEDDEWQFRAVRVGNGVEITRSDHYHGWQNPRILDDWFWTVTNELPQETRMKEAFEIECLFVPADESIGEVERLLRRIGCTDVKITEVLRGDL